MTPGLIAGMSTLGIVEVEGVRQTNDASARDTPFSAAIDVAPAINPASPPLAVHRVGGVTRAVVAPEIAGEIFAGQGAIISLADSSDILMRPRAFQFVELGEDGARAAGGSRPAAWLDLKNGLEEAQRFARNPAAFDSGRDRDSLVKRLDAEALVPVVEGRMPLIVHVERASDISQVLALKQQFPRLRLILLGAREGWLVADKIAAAKVPVITLSLFDLPDSFEALASTRSNVGRLVAAGVTVGLGIYGGDSGSQARNLPYFAGNTVAQAAVPGGVGLTKAQALETITRAPAEIFGLDRPRHARSRQARRCRHLGRRSAGTDLGPGRRLYRWRRPADGVAPDAAARPLHEPWHAGAAAAAISALGPAAHDRPSSC